MRPGPARQSVLPEASKPVRRQFGVAHGVLDVLVAEVMLQRSRIDPLVCQLEAAGMAQHVRMDAKCHLGGLTEPFQHSAKADRAHGCPALTSATRISSIPCATPSCRRTGSEASGGTN